MAEEALAMSLIFGRGEVAGVEANGRVGQRILIVDLLYWVTNATPVKSA